MGCLIFCCQVVRYEAVLMLNLSSETERREILKEERERDWNQET